MLRVNSGEEAINKIKLLGKFDKVIVGISEGKTAGTTKLFVKELQKHLSVPVEVFDETLSTHEAQELSRQTRMNRKKRKNMEDAFAATIMLQNYLDTA